MKLETAAKIKYGVWVLFLGRHAMIVGFAWGGWSTSGTTQTRTQDAVCGESGGGLCRPIYEGTEP